MCFIFSFPFDHQLVIDARIVVHSRHPNDGDIAETLFPARHDITLPLNSLNFIFQDIKTTFNYSHKLEADR